MADNDHSLIGRINDYLCTPIDWNQMASYENIFDITDENEDTLEYTTEELNRYFTLGCLYARTQVEQEEEEEEEEVVNNDEITDDMDVSTYDQIEPTPEQNMVEEDQEEESALSQQFSQLFTENTYTEEQEHTSETSQKRSRSESPSSTDDTSSKKMKHTNDQNDNNHPTNKNHLVGKEQDQTPAYLSATDQSSFDQTIREIMGTNNSIDMNNLRQMALCIHQMAALLIQKQITMVYLRSGTGQLRDKEASLSEIDRRVWPMQVKSAMAIKRRQKINRILFQSDEEHEQSDYEQLVHERLGEIKDKLEKYQIEYNQLKTKMINFTSEIEDAIVNYVQQHGIIPLQMKRDLKTALLQYDYDTEILHRQFNEEKPNEYQSQLLKSLSEAKQTFEKAKRDLIECKQRVFYHKLPSSIESVQTLLRTSTTMTSTNDTIVQDISSSKHIQSIQQKQLKFMTIRIAKAEIKFYQAQQSFNDLYDKMHENHRNLVKNKGITTAISQLIEQHLTNITHRWRAIYDYRRNFFLRTSYGDINNTNQKTENHTVKQSLIKNLGLVTYLHDDRMHHFNQQQLRLLNRGPSYVPLCQRYITSSSSSSQSIDDIIKQQYAPLKHQLASVFSKHHINIALSWEYQTNIYQKFRDLFSLSIPNHIRQRALNEMKLIQSIRSLLKEHNFILRRTADNQNTFYLGELDTFQTKSNEYLSKNDIYQVLTTIETEDKQQQWRKVFNERIQSINDALQILQRRKSLDKNIIDKLLINSTKVQLPYLYFLPDISKENELSVIPHIVSYHSITSKIARYVNQLLRSYTNAKMKLLTFSDEADFIQKLYHYTYNQYRLKSTTLFCTIQITNYLTLDEHQRMIDTIIYFLQDTSVNNKINHVSIMTIKNLLQLVLYNNLFRYDKTIYTIMKGGPHSMSLCQTLANIYLFDWQKMILEEVQRHNELFGRHKNEIFFTWNDSVDKLHSYLEVVKSRQTNVHFQVSIGSQVQFFDAYIENRQGELYTRVHHHPNLQSYTLPYAMSHSKLHHSDYLLSALLRAICYCSSVEDFHQERIYLELTYLLNGYSFHFVESHIQYFFDYLNGESMRYRSDQSLYHSFRGQWFDVVDFQRTKSEQFQTFDNNGHVIHFHYFYDYGPRCEFNREFHELWSKYFNKHATLSSDKMKVILTTKQHHSLNALLARQKLP